jgi:branched-chain amino acid transport system substrate-binding protein
VEAPATAAPQAVGLDYAPAVLIGPDGRLEEVNGAAGLRLLKADAGLLAAAAAFLHTGPARARFFWDSAVHGWLSVAVEREDRPASAPGLLVSLVAEAPPFGITSRQLDVLTLVAAGLTNQEIAARLCTSVRTVGTHVEHLLEKTGRPKRAALAALAIEQGVIRLPVPGGEAGQAGTGGLLSTPGPAGRAAGAARTGKRPFIIGSAFPLRGPAGADGHEMRNGSALAIAELNAGGGIAGRPIRQIVLDLDIFSASSVRTAFAELISAEVDALTTGYLFAEDVARELAAGYGAPFLHAMTSEAQAQQVREQPGSHGHIFQVCPTEIHYGLGFIRFLDELTASGRWQPPNRRLAFVETPLPSGHMASQAVFGRADESGWSVERCDLVPALNADWDAVLAGLGRLAPAAVMVTNFLPAELARFQRHFAQAAPPTLVYAVYTPSIPEFSQLAGPAAEGLVWSTVTGTYGDGIGLGFRSRYMRAYGRPPGRSHAGIAYDEVHLLARAWAATANPRNFAGVAEQLRRTIHRGVNGSYWLDNAGQCGLAYPDMTLDPSLGQAHLVFQVQGGEHRILSPGPYAESCFRLPPWLPGPA